MKLILIRIVKTETKAAPLADERRRVNRVVASYRGEDDHEYRKAFESYGTPTVPDSGTHAELNALARQW